MRLQLQTTRAGATATTKTIDESNKSSSLRSWDRKCIASDQDDDAATFVPG